MTVCTRADDPSRLPPLLPQPTTVDFEARVLPILREHCVSCHGPDEQESKLRLDNMLDALRGGDSGETVILPGQSQRSHLIERVTSADPTQRMPPDTAQLSTNQVDELRKWIDDEPSWSLARDHLANAKSVHWSFTPIQPTNVPESTSNNAIDGFIEQQLRKEGLVMTPAADKRRLIRRLYLVMHGLPPTVDQINKFVQDHSDDAWERLVDQVLDNPRYGERLATLWLDLVRFGETNGFETNRERPNAYHFRDWVIAAFNQDKSYARFVLEQLAGDSFGEPIGTGFLVAGPNDIVKGQDPLLGLMQRQDELADIVNATGTTFLGLTTGCARCHNHKFDPITQTDYYALQAVFAGVVHGEPEMPASPAKRQEIDETTKKIQQMRSELAKFSIVKGARDPVNPVENIELFAATEAKFLRFTINATNGSEPCIDEVQVFAGLENIALQSSGAKATSSGDFEHPLHKLEHLNDGQFGNARSWIASTAKGGWAQVEFDKVTAVDRVVWGRDRTGQFKDRVAIDYHIELSIDGVTWQVVASSANRRPLNQEKTSIQQFELTGLDAAEAEWVRAQVAILQELEQARSQLLSSAKVYCGTFVQPGPTPRLHRGDPTAPRELVNPGAIATLVSLNLPQDAPERMRRIALANWIASPDNPLTARVMVNRLWQFHFGTGIVDTPSDFGANGTLPSHPELLDWLAAEFIQTGWSIKKLHRLILTSQTWRQDSKPRKDCLAIDANTRMLWRFPIRRLEAEGIRDCILAATGKLDLRVGGPGFSAFEVELENVRHYFPKKDYGPDDWRRMVYMTKVRMEKDSIFGVFDCPDGSQVTPRRNRSTTPLQALNLLNSRFVMQQAEYFIERLHRERNSPEGQVDYAFELCFGREPQTDERQEAQDFIDQHGWLQFARALFNANEFTFIP